MARRRAMSVFPTEKIDARFEAVDIVAEFSNVVREPLHLVAAGNVATLFLEILANVVAHRRSGVPPPLTETARDLASRNPFLQIVAYSGAMDPDAVMDSLNAGDIDYAIEDQNRLEAFLDYRGDIQPGIALTTERPLAWAVSTLSTSGSAIALP